MLREALDREALPELDVEHVDAYHLALCLWPTATSHRLARLCDDVGVDRTGLGWHDAVDDARRLDRLIRASADLVASWPAGLRNLIAAACPDSPGWSRLLHLAGHDGEARVTFAQRRSLTCSTG